MRPNYCGCALPCGGGVVVPCGGSSPAAASNWCPRAESCPAAESLPRWRRCPRWRRRARRRRSSRRSRRWLHPRSRRPHAHPWRTWRAWPDGRRWRRWPRVALAHQFHIENQLRLRRNRPLASLAIRQLVRNEQPPLAADVHPFKTRVPARNHLMLAIGKRNRLAARMVVR